VYLLDDISACQLYVSSFICPLGISVDSVLKVSIFLLSLLYISMFTFAEVMSGFPVLTMRVVNLIFFGLSS